MIHKFVLFAGNPHDDAFNVVGLECFWGAWDTEEIAKEFFEQMVSATWGQVAVFNGVFFEMLWRGERKSFREPVEWEQVKTSRSVTFHDTFEINVGVEIEHPSSVLDAILDRPL